MPATHILVTVFLIGNALAFSQGRPGFHMPDSRPRLT